MADAGQNEPMAIDQPVAQAPEAPMGVPEASPAIVESSDQTMGVEPTNPDESSTSALIENHSNESEAAGVKEEHSAPVAQAASEPPTTASVNEGDKESGDGDGEGDLEMSDHGGEYSDDGSEYQPEPESPKPAKVKLQKSPVGKTAKTPNPKAAAASSPTTTTLKTPKTPANPKTPKTPISRVRSGRVEKTGTPTPGNLRCPVKGCGQTFTGRNPRQSLWHHLKYYATRGTPDRVDFEKLHGDAHAQMKRDAEPKGTPVERNRISSSDYRKKNPEKAKTSARLSNFRARARKKGLTTEAEVEEAVAKWEKEWQEKQAKEASEYFSGILLSAFE